MKLKKILMQPSTARGIALVVSAAAVATGHGEIFNASIGDAGLQLGGLGGVLITSAIGLYDVVRDEFK